MLTEEQGTNTDPQHGGGNPGKIIKTVSDEMLAWKTEGTRLYQQLPAQCYESLRPCEPFRVMPMGRKGMDGEYERWGVKGKPE